MFDSNTPPHLTPIRAPLPLWTLSETGVPLIIPVAHDALSARMIEMSGFPAVGVGGASIGATQLAIPDIGLMNFGEYRDAVDRVLSATNLPALVDADNGFGDVTATARSIVALERLGASGVVLEDLTMPQQIGSPPKVEPRQVIADKVTAALAIRTDSNLAIIGRTDAAYAVSIEEGLERAILFEKLGVDAVLVPRLPDLEAYSRLRDAVRIPVIAVCAPGWPWFSPTIHNLVSIGIEGALFPGTVMAHVVTGIRHALDALLLGKGAPPHGFDGTELAEIVRSSEWAAIQESSC